MPATQSPWKTLSLTPLTGVLDLRSRPAEVPQGGFRYKLNMACTQEGKLCRADGFTKAFADFLYDADSNLQSGGTIYHNHDHHHQGATWEPITFGYEHTTSDGQRVLFDGTQSRVSRLNQSTGYWDDLVTGKGAFGSRWRAASLQDYVLFTNGVDDVYSHAGGVTPYVAGPIPELQAITVSAAKVIIEFQGIILVMNVKVGGVRKPTTIYWSDLNGPLTWNIAQHPAPETVLCGTQDLPYGDEILAAAPMLNSLYIYTRRSIWKCTVSSVQEKVFEFQRVYYEPKNQAGCLVYPFTLISTGSDHYYMSRESIYHYNPYMPKPECEDQDMDWLHRAAGAIFTKADTRLSGIQCNAPYGEYVPTKKELWFSWPSGNKEFNNWTLVAQVARKTADLRDVGFTVMCNFRRTPTTQTLCNEIQDFLACASVDWCLKDIGGVFYREYVTTAEDLATDIDLLSANFVRTGYYSELKGQIPTGLFDREKIIRRLLIDSDDSEQAPPPCVIHAYIGNSQTLTDPNDLDVICAPQWTDLKTVPLACPNSDTIPNLSAKNLRAASDKDFACYDQGRFLFFWIRIENADGSAAIGGDSCFQRLDFDVMPLSKP